MATAIRCALPDGGQMSSSSISASPHRDAEREVLGGGPQFPAFSTRNSFANTVLVEGSEVGELGGGAGAEGGEGEGFSSEVEGADYVFVVGKIKAVEHHAVAGGIDV